MALVLVADDDLDICALVEQRLLRAGHRVILAHDGDEALRLVGSERPDLLVMDVNMPGRDGFAVCETVCQSGPDPPPVIFLTARAQTAERVRGFEVGGVDYVVKPFQGAELLARIESSLRTKRRIDRLIEAAVVDRLTGVGTRAALDERLEHAFAHARRSGQPFACVVVDVDNFKSINDAYGHGGGDVVLREVAGRLRAAARRSDEVFRYGGDEFVVLFLESRLDGIEAPAERLLAAVAARRVHVPAGDGVASISVRASAGAAVARAEHPGATSLLAEADGALYEAKRAGRARVVVAAPPSTRLAGAASPA